MITHVLFTPEEIVQLVHDDDDLESIIRTYLREPAVPMVAKVIPVALEVERVQLSIEEDLETVCLWGYNGVQDFWYTSCGHVLLSEYRKEEVCPICGKKVVVIRGKEEVGNDYPHSV